MALTTLQITQLDNMNVASQRAGGLGTIISQLTGTSKAVATTALGTVRVAQGSGTASATGIASGNLVGARGDVTLSGTVTGGAYLYGSQGKLLVTGTMNHADARLCGSLAQLDISQGTYTAGQLSVLWVDAAQVLLPLLFLQRAAGNSIYFV
jgi:hypothetical protein